MTVLLFIVILSILIIVHEAGHFLTAKMLGVRVEEFALGFGPKLFSRTIGGTNYRICAILLGGYVKMAGDDRSKCEGKPDEYFSKSPGHRALIVLMGPVVNYILGYICFVLVFMIGYLDIVKASKDLPAKIGVVAAGSPAAKAGVKVGDKVVSIDGKPIAYWDEMQTLIMDSAGKTIELSVLNDGVERIVRVAPDQVPSKDVFGREKIIGRIGIQPAGEKAFNSSHIERYGLFGAMTRASKELWSVTNQTYVALWDILTGKKSAKEGVTGLIGIFFIIKFAIGLGISFLIYIVGALSASLAIFNLIPLIPLDGGHLALLGLEKVRRRPLSVKVDEIIGKVGFGLIILLAVYVFYIDFERIGLIDKLASFFIK